MRAIGTVFEGVAIVALGIWVVMAIAVVPMDGVPTEGGGGGVVAAVGMLVVDAGPVGVGGDIVGATPVVGAIPVVGMGGIVGNGFIDVCIGSVGVGNGVTAVVTGGGTPVVGGGGTLLLVAGGVGSGGTVVGISTDDCIEVDWRAVALTSAVGSGPEALGPTSAI